MREQLVELRVAYQLGVVIEDLRNVLFVGRRQHGAAVGRVVNVNVNDSVASMIAPTKPRPKESPNDPLAEFTPAASLPRSWEIGARA